MSFFVVLFLLLLNSTTFFVGATPASKAASGSLNRRSESKLDSRASRESLGSELQGSKANRGSPPTNSRGGRGNEATMSVVMSAESAQRLKARAAESGLHQSDSGLASESQWLSEPNVVIVVVSFCLGFADGMPKCTACQARRLS